MIRYWLLFISTVFTLPILGNNIEVILVQQSNLISAPGKVNNFSILLKNNGTNPTELNLQLDMPTDWKVISNQKSIKLDSKEKSVKILSFVVPTNALAGSYEITYRLINKAHQKEEATKKFTFQVDETNKLEVIPLNAPRTVIAGAKLTASFLVKNTSNQNQTILLSTEDAKIIGSPTIKLAAFTSHKLDVETTTSPDIRKEGRLSLQLTATLESSRLMRTGFLHTQLIPSIDYGADNTLKLPGFASINLLHRQYGDGRVGQGWQGELFLQGAIDKTDKKEITLSLRGPNQQDATELTLQDEYYASYQSEKIKTTIGDNNFALSTLTEFSRNGRGVEMEAYFGKATIGGFYVRPRFFSAVKAETGFFIENEFNKKALLRFNYLHKNQLGHQGTASIMSFSGVFNPLQNTLLEAEMAAGNSGESAYLNLQSTYFKRVRINGNLIYASPKFTGYFQNTFNFSGNVSYKLNKKIDLVAGIFQDKRNAALDTLLLAAPFSDRRHVGFRLKLGANTQFQFNLRQNEVEDQLPQKQFFQKERLLFLGINQNIRRFSFGLSSEYGVAHNFLQSIETDAQKVFRVYTDLGWKIGDFSLTAFGQYFNKNSWQITSQKQFLWGTAVSGVIKKNTRFEIRYQNDFEVATYYKNRNAFDLSIAQTIRKKSQLILNARQTIRRNTLNHKDFALSAKYVYNFGIRLEEKPKTGNIYGFLKRSNGKSTKGVIVYLNGRTAVTNSEGQFKFKSVPPGQYPLMIDPSTMDLHEILADNALPTIVVLPETDQEVHLKLIQSGAILGALEFKRTQPRAQIISLEAVGSILLQISNGTETRRTFTDEKGQYQFGDLKPGEWKLEVLSKGLNKKYKIAKSTYTVRIEEGQKTNLPILIQDKKRNIQFKRLINLSDDDG